MPAKKPMAAGSQAVTPCCSAMSMAGIISDQTEAAIITPEARFHPALQEEHKAGAQRGAEEWYQYADGGLERFVHGARLLFDRIISQKAQKGIQRNIYFFVNFFGVRRVIIYRETDRR